MSSVIFPSLVQIVRNLPGIWTIQDEKEEFGVLHAVFVRNDGFKIFVAANHYGFREKIQFSFVRPRDDKGNYVELYTNPGKISDPSIACSLSKTEDKLAQDIIRRLLPDAERVFALAKEKINSFKEAENKRLALLRQMTEAAGAPVPAMDRHQNQLFSFYLGQNNSCEVETGYSSVDISLRNLPPHRAERIIRFLRSMDEK